MSNNKVKLPNHIQKRVKSSTTPVLAPPAKNLQYSQEKNRENSQDVLTLDFSSQVTTIQGATQSSMSSYKTCKSASVKRTPQASRSEEDEEEEEE